MYYSKMKLSLCTTLKLPAAGVNPIQKRVPWSRSGTSAQHPGCPYYFSDSEEQLENTMWKYIVVNVGR